MVALSWLRQNSYEDVADLIDLVLAENRAAGRKTRRNWWDTLSGRADGSAVSVNGRLFPVLRVAQVRQGKPITPNALCRNETEVPPDVVATKRWPRRHLPSKARQLRKPGNKHRQASRAS